MNKDIVTRNIVSHLVTVFISSGVFFSLAYVTAIWKMRNGGETDPLMFIAAGSVGVLFVVIALLFACPLALILQVLRVKLRFSTWVPVILVFPFLYTILLSLRFSLGQLPCQQVSFSVSLALSVAVSVYWLTLAVVNWTRRKY